MTVLLKSNLSTIGGLEKQTYYIANALSKIAHLTILTYGPVNFIHPNVTVEDIGKKPFFGWKRITKFNSLCEEWQKKHTSNTVLSMDRTTCQTHMRLGNGVYKAFLQNRRKFDGTIKYLSHKINPLHQNILLLEKIALTSPLLKKIFVNSYMVKEEILSYYPVDSKKIIVIHNGVEYHSWESAFNQSLQNKKHIAKKLKANPHLHNFLFIGNGYYRKGLKLLFHALSHLPKNQFFLHIIGRDKNPKYYLRLAKRLNIVDNVRFYGLLSNTLPFYQLCDTLIIPSFYDPFANVTIEALAMGLFVISSKENGAHEIITKNTGITLNNLQDEEELTFALQQALLREKNTNNALPIRQSVSHLDLSSQITKLTNALYE